MTDRELVFSVKRIRENKRLTQEYLAEALGMTPSNYSKLENGKVRLSYDVLKRIALTLNVTVEYIEAYGLGTSTERPPQIFHIQNPDFQGFTPPMTICRIIVC